TPYRGLDVLLRAFPLVRSAVPNVRLRVFSGLAVYQVSEAQDPHAGLYRLARETAGVEYVGPVGQRRLAEELAGVGALAYPSTFAETSCICVLEAMATGAAVLTTKLGALPETAAGHARMIEYQHNKGDLANAFAELTISSLRSIEQDPKSEE